MTEKANEAKANEARCERTGGCLCGGVRFTIEANTPHETIMRPLIACHCEQCRKTSGTFVVSSKVKTKHLTFQTQATLVWYDSSKGAERGFCSRCGSSLFYRRKQQKDESKEEAWSVMLGTLDQANDLPFAGHIFAQGAHPMLARLSTTPQCEQWGEQPLIDALNEQGWYDTKSLTTHPSS